MTDETINYSFTGDVSSLAGATEKAINLLNSIESSYKKAAEAGKLVGSKTSVKNFNSALASSAKRARDLVDTLKEYGDMEFGPDTAQLNNVHQALDALTEVNTYLQQFSDGAKIDSTDVGLFTSYLQDARRAMAELNTQTIATQRDIGNLSKNLVTDALGEAVDNIKETIDIIPTSIENLEAAGMTGVANVLDSMVSPAKEVSEAVQEATASTEELNQEWAAAEALSAQLDPGESIASHFSAANDEAAEMTAWMDLWNAKLEQYDGNVKRTSADMKELSDKAARAGETDLTSRLEADQKAMAAEGVDTELPTPDIESLDIYKSKLSGIVGLVGKLGEGVSRVAQLFGGIVKFGMSPFVKAFNKIQNQVHKFTMTFSRILRGKAVRAIIKGFEDGFTSLAQHSTEAANALGSMQASLSTVGGSLVAAFAPALESVAALIDSLTSKIITLINALGQLIAKLSGKGFYTKAVKSMKSFGAATGGAASAAKELNNELLGIDELNVLQPSGGGGGGGGGGGAGGDTGYTFVDVPFDDTWLNDMAEKIREAFEAGEYAEVGQLLGEVFNKGIETFDEYIKWDNVGPKVTEFLDKWITIFNNFVYTVDWTRVGVTIADALVTGMMTVKTFFELVDWSALGQALGDAINGFFSVNGLEVFLQTCATIIHSIATGLISAIETVDWTMIGISIGVAIANVDWNSLFMDVMRVIGAALKAAIELTFPLLLILLNKLGHDLVEFILDVGKEIALMVAPGCGDWYDTAIKEPVLDLFPTTEELADKLARKFGNKVKESLKGPAAKDGVEGMNSAYDTTRKASDDNWIKLTSSIEEHAGDIPNRTNPKFEQLSSDTSERFDQIRDDSDETWTGIKDETIETADLMATEVTSKFEEMPEKVNAAWIEITSGMTGPMSDSISAVQTWINDIITAINAMIRSVDKVSKSELGRKANIRGTGLSPMSAPALTPLATGGVVTRATAALLGEGRYEEAVIPLGNSPQLEQLVSRIADAVSNKGEQVVKVVIGGRDWDTHIYNSAKRGEVRVGARPVKVGGY